jgi:hypothetical protein
LNYDNGRVIYKDKKFNDIIKYKKYIEELRSKNLDEENIKNRFNERYPYVEEDEYINILSLIQKDNIDEIMVKEMDYALLKPDIIYQRTKDNIWGKIDYLSDCMNELSKFDEYTIEDILNKIDISDKSIKNNKSEESKNNCIEYKIDDDCIPKRFYNYFISIYILKTIIDDIDYYKNYKNEYKTILLDIKNKLSTYKLKDTDLFNKKQKEKSDSKVPKEYQNKLIYCRKIKDKEQKKALNAWARAGFKGSVIAGTGFGKSRIGVIAIGETLRRGFNRNGIVLVPTTQLQEQFKDEFHKWGYQDETHRKQQC